LKNDLYLADLFAGGGGFSTGIAAACKQLGRKPDLVAINHWKVAMDTHTRNHPWARHLCTGLDAVHPTEEVRGGRLNLLAASPECTHHSNARGGKPMNDQSRSSAWLILKWLQELYVEAVLIENVQEFEDWGPLGADGRPLKSMSGALFDQFIASLKALGYNVEWRVLNAANYGGATTRERLFIMARRGRNKRIIWPDHSHAQFGDRQGEMFGDKERWRPARDIIDWNQPSRSIFTRKKPLAPATLERIAAGLRKFGGAAAEPFLVVLRQHMGARSLDEPPPTLTTSMHVGLAEPFFFNMQRNQDPILSTDRPMPTITATSNDYGLVEPFVLSMEHSKSGAQPPFVIPLNHGRTNGGGQRVYDVNNPMPTITTVDGWGVVEPFIITAGGPVGQGRTPKDINNPLPTVLTDDRHALIQPMLVEYHGSHPGRNDGARRVRSVDDPLPTQTTENRFGLLEPLIVSYYGTQNVSRVSQPLPTVTTKDRFGLVEFGDGLYLDIHFRMLSYRELSNAMGFPAEYEFAGNRGDKVKQIGNSVEVRTATALAKSALAA
jgi:DNA (cytosine-5)-methyltransferase 1